MSLKKEIENAMLKESYDTKLDDISQMTGIKREEVEAKVDALSFKDYITVMSAYNDKNEELIKDMLGASETVEAVQGAVSVSDKLNQQRQQTPYQQARNKVANPDKVAGNDIVDKTRALQRLGKDNLGGMSAQQTAKAIDKAEQGKALTGQEKQALAKQAQNLDSLTSDPKTATQFRQLLNRLK